ncbi:hypothetical protein N7G274_005594 [Stereocaulon virgatum]|uniref:Uncharacterized protein n=1 Tax=Stereocaulon virgatum TaxID=373712 RepID=A0ABR4A7N0_9LECA
MMLEQNVGIIAACIPTLKPLLRKTFHFHWPKGLRRRGGKAADDDEVQLHALTYTSKEIAVGIRQVDLDHAQAGEQTRDEAG